jgi:hypothetical protein
VHDITVDQVRRFADTARLPAAPVWRIVRETVERTAAAWRTLDQKELLPPAMQESIDSQIHQISLKAT